jgi:hypothetical protein
VGLRSLVRAARAQRKGAFSAHRSLALASACPQRLPMPRAQRGHAFKRKEDASADSARSPRAHLETRVAAAAQPGVLLAVDPTHPNAPPLARSHRPSRCRFRVEARAGASRAEVENSVAHAAPALPESKRPDLSAPHCLLALCLRPNAAVREAKRGLARLLVSPGASGSLDPLWRCAATEQSGERRRRWRRECCSPQALRKPVASSTPVPEGTKRESAGQGADAQPLHRNAGPAGDGARLETDDRRRPRAGLRPRRG